MLEQGSNSKGFRARAGNASTERGGYSAAQITRSPIRIHYSPEHEHEHEHEEEDEEEDYGPAVYGSGMMPLLRASSRSMSW